MSLREPEIGPFKNFDCEKFIFLYLSIPYHSDCRTPIITYYQLNFIVVLWRRTATE